LNCGLGSKDSPAHVHENRSKVAADLGVGSDHLLTAYQVHSSVAAIVEQPWQEAERPKVDAIVTNTPGLAVGVLTADCAPVLFCDPNARVVAAAHAGWRGAIEGVLDHTISQMEAIGAKRERIVASVGPAISLAAYEVGEEFQSRFLAEEAGNSRFFAKPAGAAKVHFDLQAYVRHRLEASGLQDVGVVQHCTFAGEGWYFSYRRSQRDGHQDYGRQISAIVII
jgi:YfiH family protein